MWLSMLIAFVLYTIKQILPGAQQNYYLVAPLFLSKSPQATLLHVCLIHSVLLYDLDTFGQRELMIESLTLHP